MQHEQVAQIFERAQAAQEAHGLPPRVVFVYAHPDDEAIALGAHLSLFRDALFVQVTDGAPADNADGERLGLARDEYRSTRALEVRAAFAAAGIPEARHRSLNLPDKAAAFHLAELAGQIAHIFREERPVAVFTHPYEGGHADHDSCAFAVHIACGQLDGDIPVIIESPFYFANVDGTMHAGDFLQEDHASTHVVVLSPEQQRRKRDIFAAFATQAPVLAAFPIALTQERFRIAPEYDFCEPAMEGATYYEAFIPGLNAVRFSQLASQALHGIASAAERSADSGRPPATRARVVTAADSAADSLDLPGGLQHTRNSLP